MRLAAACAIALLAIAGCAGDPRSVKIGEEHKDNPFDAVKDTEGLSAEDVRLLLDYQKRLRMAEIVREQKPKVAGRTVGDLIADQRKFEADDKARAAEQERLAKEATAKREAIASELRKTLAFAVFEKGEHTADYQEYITIKCAYENKSDRDIRAFRGAVRFADLFGVEIYTTRLTIDDPIKAGQKGQWSGVIEYNKFVNESRRFKNADLKDMKVEWLPATIMFADGTQIGDAETGK